MDDLVVEGLAEGLAGLLGAEAADLPGVGGGVVGQAAGELVAVGVADADDVALLELADDLDDADGQQALRARSRARGGRRRRRRNGPAAGPSGRSSASGRPGSGRGRGRGCRPARPRGSGSAGSGFLPEAMMTEPPAWVTSRAACELAPHPAGPQRAPARAGQAEDLVVEVRDQRDRPRRSRPGAGVGRGRGRRPR